LKSEKSLGSAKEERNLLENLDKKGITMNFFIKFQMASLIFEKIFPSFIDNLIFFPLPKTLLTHPFSLFFFLFL